MTLSVVPPHDKSHLSQVGGHRQRSSTDTMVLVCSMISQYHVTKVSSNIGRSVSKLVTMLPTLVVT